jgi:hypothetical protein
MDAETQKDIFAYECMTSRIMKTTIAENGEEKVARYAANSKPASNVVDAARRIIGATWPNDGFSSQLHKGSLNKLFFKDGLYDFETKSFRQDDPESDFTTIRIMTDFPQDQSRDVESEKFVWDVLDGIFNERPDVECFLAHVARALSGAYTDKSWIVVHGGRNSGKGIMQELMREALGPYVGTVNATEMMMDSHRGSGGDQAKRLSWLLEVANKRVIITNEITIDAQDNKCKLDGNKIKGTFGSGGDPKQVRQLYTKEQEVVAQGRLMMMCNDLPPIDPPDALETVQVFKTDHQYVTEEKLQEARESGGAEASSHLRVRDAALKSRCRQAKVAQAFVRLVLDAYTDEPVAMSPRVHKYTTEFQIDSETGGAALRRLIEFTGNKLDRLTIVEVEDKARQNGININKLAIGVELKRIGGERNNAALPGQPRSWGFAGVRFKAPANAEETS